MDLVSRLTAKAEQAAKDQRDPIRARVRAQVRSIVEGIHPKPVAERNREGYITAMIAKGEPVYAGTANPKAVAKRRARNRMARQSRRANR